MQVPAHLGTGLADPAAIERLPESAVTAILQALPLESRVVVHLADAEGFAYKEIAEITGVPAGSGPEERRAAGTPDHTVTSKWRA